MEVVSGVVVITVVAEVLVVVSGVVVVTVVPMGKLIVSGNVTHLVGSINCDIAASRTDRGHSHDQAMKLEKQGRPKGSFVTSDSMTMIAMRWVTMSYHLDMD